MTSKSRQEMAANESTADRLYAWAVRELNYVPRSSNGDDLK
jgi:hypothetical protein